MAHTHTCCGCESVWTHPRAHDRHVHFLPAGGHGNARGGRITDLLDGCLSLLAAALLQSRRHPVWAANQRGRRTSHPWPRRGPMERIGRRPRTSQCVYITRCDRCTTARAEGLAKALNEAWVLESDRPWRARRASTLAIHLPRLEEGHPLVSVRFTCAEAEASWVRTSLQSQSPAALPARKSRHTRM